MKFLEKVKNMFTEEVEEEITPVKTEIQKVEIPVSAPIKKEDSSTSNAETVTKTEIVKPEEKPKAPVFFDDKDFDKLPTASNVEKKEEKVEPVKTPAQKSSAEPVRKEAYGGKKPAYTASTFKEEKKMFKPTPIISPVYGVLDKNYRKDDIAPKKRVAQSNGPKELTVDEKLNIIGNEYDIPVEENFRKDVGVMCNLSQGIKEDGIAIGEARIIISMYNNGFTAEQIAAATDKDIKDIEIIIRGKELATV